MDIMELIVVALDVPILMFQYLEEVLVLSLRTINHQSFNHGGFKHYEEGVPKKIYFKSSARGAWLEILLGR